MLKQLKYKNELIPGYFISDEGKIYDAEGVEQKTYIKRLMGYSLFKKKRVHELVIHSFLGYKEGHVIHHKNQVKTDNRIQNLVYLTRSEHCRIHSSILHKQQTRNKLSQHAKGNRYRFNKGLKAVYCVQLNMVFDSIKDAGNVLSLHQSSISRCCQGKLKTTGGYHWQYIDEVKNEQV